MKHLFMFLCIVIMFFGIVGCPDNNNTPPTKTITSGVVNNPQVGNDTSVSDISGDGGVSQVPEPATLLLIGSGLVGLAGLVRKRFKK